MAWMKRIYAPRIERGGSEAKRAKRMPRVLIENASNGNQVPIRYMQKFERHETDAAFIPSNLCARLN